ncbi:IclR family transcriptional regulator [Verticiella sediminum]|uniref:IclR family transcriptional regulator n=1 Tax=Verticiella sediminum TaxID=1247510 RepID=A0A556AU17_9BURK|nr:IclR family transcriptional regulator [Verticiella sediminum]TSH96427.1 IclR family transcriptional regulator [Verticiella sediminum]
MKDDEQEAATGTPRVDPLTVHSVIKAFAVLDAFGGNQRSLSLAQIAALDGMGKSAAQRFAHTLTKLGYLAKDPQTKRFELTARTLTLGSHYIQTNELIGRATPYLQELSNSIRETVNLTVPSDTSIIFAARFASPHVLNADVVVGTELPAYCTAPGIAILSRLPRDEAMNVLRRSDRVAHTPYTVRSLPALEEKLDQAQEKGYAVAWEEYYLGDLSIAAPLLGPDRRPVGAINVSVARTRYTPEQAEAQFAPLVISAVRAIT